MSEALLYPYQRRWLSDDSRFKAGMFARQTGKTFTTTLEIVLDCLAAEAAGRRTRWVILSRGERQAREAMEEGVKRHLRALNVAFKSQESDYLDGVRAKMLEVTLPGGSRVTALPANPDTARGFSANVFLDEFAFHADSRKIWMALFPVISAGWKLRVVSTPNGKGNKFYELMTGEDAAWSRHTVDLHQAIADGLPRNAEELRAGLNDEDAWAQEFELRWLDEASAWLSFDLLNAVEHDGAGIPGGYQGGHTYIGNDIGRKKDLWSAWVWERVGDVLWTREVRTLKRATFREQDQVLDDLMTRYHPVRIGIDQTGMGEKPVEDAQRRYGSLRVEGVMFTAASKQHMANLAKEAFEDRQVRIPLGDQKIRADLHSLKKVTTPAGNVRFDVEGGDGHADRAWAAFLGIYAASTSTAPIEYQSTGRREAAAAFDDYARTRAIATNTGFGTVAGGADLGGF